jgi:hypothetical protein
MFLSYFSLLKLFLNHNNHYLIKPLSGGVQITQKKTAAITIQDHRSLWNSSNPEEGVYLLILNMKHRSFHLHTSSSCSPPSIRALHILVLGHHAHMPHILAICCTTSTSCSPFFHLQTHLLASHSGDYKSCPLTPHLHAAVCITFSPSLHLVLRIASTLKHGAYMAPRAV